MSGQVALSAFILAVATGVVLGVIDEADIKFDDRWYMIPVLSGFVAFGAFVTWLISLVWS